MKKSLFAVAFVALALVSCNKKEEVKAETTDMDSSTTQVETPSVDSTKVQEEATAEMKEEATSEMKEAAAEGAAQVEEAAKEAKEEMKK